MKDFKDTVSELFCKLVDEKGEEIIGKALEAMLNSVIGNCVGRYGGISNSLEDILKEKLESDLGKLNMESLSDMIIDNIQSKVDKKLSIAVDEIGDSVVKIVNAPEYNSIKLSELCEKFKDTIVQECCSDDGGKIDVEVNVSTGIYSSWNEIVFINDASKVSALISLDAKHIFSVKYSEGKIDMTGYSRGPVEEFSRLLKKLQCYRVEIEIDSLDGIDFEYYKESDC